MARYLSDSALMASQLQSLRLPPLVHTTGRFATKGTSKGEIGRQTYQYFADKARKMNPGVEFTKSMMDNAFSSVAEKVKKLSSEKGNPAMGSETDMNKMLKRVSCR
ncbi:hypothetical protein LTR27_007780 [Elasticomyces elasticus]|nr:hypothetical protein LTR27_007780 [Elasticomyces elasticus]